MIIDTHSHIQFNAFKNDSEEVIKKTLAEDIWIINVGTKYETSKAGIAVAEHYQRGVYAAIGLHPMYAVSEFIKLKTDPDEGEFLNKEQEFDAEKYRILGQSKKVVAVGEVGLDYYYKPKSSEKIAQFKEKQKHILSQQLDLALDLDMPVIFHCRMAHYDLIELLALRSQTEKIPGVVHCFTGTTEEMNQYVALGLHIGINGIIFKLPLDEVVKNCPLEHMLVETDCPYLTPAPEGIQRNEPIFIKHTIQKIADLKGISFDEVCQKTTENAKKLFNI